MFSFIYNEYEIILNYNNKDGIAHLNVSSPMVGIHMRWIYGVLAV